MQNDFKNQKKALIQQDMNTKPEALCLLKQINFVRLDQNVTRQSKMGICTLHDSKYKLVRPDILIAWYV